MDHLGAYLGTDAQELLALVDTGWKWIWIVKSRKEVQAARLFTGNASATTPPRQALEDSRQYY